MSGQKRPADPSGSSSSGAPPEKRREREGEDGGAGVSAAAGGSTAVETVIKLGGVSNSVSHRFFPLYCRCVYSLHPSVKSPCLSDCLFFLCSFLNSFSGRARHQSSAG